MASTPGTPVPVKKKKRGRALLTDNRKTVLGVVAGALLAAFAVLNLHNTKVDWILGTWKTPLILVIAVAFLLGAAVGIIAGELRRRPRKKP